MKNYKIIIKENNIAVLDSIINQIPYGFAKPLVDFINSCAVEDKPEEKLIDHGSQSK